MSALAPALAAPLLQLGGMLATPLGKLLVAILVVGVVVLVGRIVLNIAWKLVLIAAVVVGALWLVSTFLGGF